MTVKHEGVTYTVTEAGTFAFYSCTALKSLTLPNSVKITDATPSVSAAIWHIWIWVPALRHWSKAP